MKYQRNDMRPFLKGPEMRKVCTLAAGRVLSRARRIVGKSSGRTAASGRLVHGYGGKSNDRVRVTVEFGGAAVEEQFGNKHRRASRFLTRALDPE